MTAANEAPLTIAAICTTAAQMEASENLTKDPYPDPVLRMHEQEAALQKAAALMPPALHTIQTLVVNWSDALRFLLTEDRPPQAEVLTQDGAWQPLELTPDQKWGIAVYFDRTLADEPGMPRQKHIR